MISSPFIINNNIQQKLADWLCIVVSVLSSGVNGQKFEAEADIFCMFQK